VIATPVFWPVSHWQLTKHIAIPIIAAEETMRGWLSAIAKERQVKRQVYGYGESGNMFRFFAAFEITLFEDAAANQFEKFSRIRIGASDRKIAAIALVNNALLLTANRRDYEQIPELRFENWTEPPLLSNGDEQENK